MDTNLCRIAGFQTRGPSASAARSTLPRHADLEIGDTADLEVCATRGRTGLRALQGLAFALLLLAASVARGVDFHVATAQDLQNALTLAAANGADDTIWLTNG